MFTFELGRVHGRSRLQKNINNMLLSRNIIKVFTRSATRTSLIRVRNESLQNLFIHEPKVIKWEAIRKEVMENDRTVNKNVYSS